MSPRSRRKPARKSREGAKAPSLRSRLANIEHFLANLPVTATEVNMVASAARNALTPQVSIPPIKARIEGILGYATQLNSRLDALNHVLFADSQPGSVAGSGEPPQPYAIPDQLSLLEDLLRRAIDRVTTIHDRF